MKMSRNCFALVARGVGSVLCGMFVASCAHMAEVSEGVELFFDDVPDYEDALINPVSRREWQRKMDGRVDIETKWGTIIIGQPKDWTEK